MFIIYSDYLIIMDTLCVYTNRVECQDAIKLDIKKWNRDRRSKKYANKLEIKEMVPKCY